MSTDYNVVCDTCRLSRHLGQRMASSYSFGFGSKDQDGANAAAGWMFGHIELGHAVRIEVSDSGLARPSDDYRYVHDEPFRDPEEET